MSYLSIGSGDVESLLMGKQTKGYADLWRKFLGESAPYYNSFASPIDALRTGAILERNYLNYLGDEYYVQVKQTYSEMDIFTSSLDFAKIESNKVVDFDELKTIWFTDYIDIIKDIEAAKDPVGVIKKKFKKNYQQVQFQLLCSNLQSANLVFLSVTSYDDNENKARVIQDNEVTRFRITRDEDVINQIIDRGKIFQEVKDHFEL